MTYLSEQIYHVRRFQEDRKGLAELNTIQHCLFRALLEIQEAEAAHFDPEQTIDDLIEELIDVQMFISAALKVVCDEQSIEPEELDRRYEAKGRKNEKRYAEEHFNMVGMSVAGKKFTAQDAVNRSRHHAKNNFTGGSDVY